MNGGRLPVHHALAGDRRRLPTTPKWSARVTRRASREWNTRSFIPRTRPRRPKRWSRMPSRTSTDAVRCSFQWSRWSAWEVSPWRRSSVPLGGTPKPLIDAIAAGKIRGRSDCGLQQPAHQAGLRPRDPDAAVDRKRHPRGGHGLCVGGHRQGRVQTVAGHSKRRVPASRRCAGRLGVPPVLHVGSCVDNVRILVLASAAGQ